MDHLSCFTPSFSMSKSPVISQSKKEVMPSFSNNEKISECLGVVTKWQVLVEETVASTEANWADNAFLPPVSSCHSTAFDTELLSDELKQITANSDVVHLMAVVTFPRWLWPDGFSSFSWFLGIKVTFFLLLKSSMLLGYAVKSSLHAQRKAEQ